MSYRGPNPQRIMEQFGTINQHNAEVVIWQKYLSGSTGTASGYWGGGGTTATWHEQRISALWAAPQGGESRFRETQLPGGQAVAGDAIVSTLSPFGPNDQLIWRGTTYRIEGDSVPTHIGGRLWYRTVLRRGVATG